MNRILRISLAVLLLFSMAVPVSAEETQSEQALCTIRADSLSGRPGETVTVPVRIEHNPGFTNFGIALDYDREQLELVSIQPEEMCGSCAESSIAWDPEKDASAAQNDSFSENMTYGYVNCALGEAAEDNGVLFMATFRLTEAFAEEAEVTPVVNYIRRQGTEPEIFDDLQVQTAAGCIRLNTQSTVKSGDVNADGYITADDAASAFAASKDASQLTQEQKKAADVTGDGYITADDAAQIFAMSKSNSEG